MIIGSRGVERKLYPIERLAIQKTGIKSKRLRLVATPAHITVAENLSRKLGIPLTPVKFSQLASGFWRAQLQESVKGADLFIIHTANTMTLNADMMHLYSLLTTISQLPPKQRPAKVVASSLHFPYARQDRKAAPREPISAAAMANLVTSVHYPKLTGITSGMIVRVDEKRVVDRIIIVNLHSASIEGFFQIPVDHLDTIPLMVSYIRRKAKRLEDVIVTGPDAGRSKMAIKIAEELFGEKAHGHLINIAKVRGHKKSDGSSAIESVIVGNVKDKQVFIVDDIVDTGKTLLKAAEMLIKEGASQVLAVATHATLSGPASQDIAENASLSGIGLINTLNIPPEKLAGLGGKATVIYSTQLLRRVIEKTFVEQTIEPYQSET